MLTWTDTHSHLDRLEVTADQAVAEAKQAGVDRLITIGTHPDDHPTVIALAEKFAPHVFCTLGVHPHDAQAYDDACEAFILANVAHPRVVAIGEIGLDYYYEHSPRDIQGQVFRRQMDLSVKSKLPVQIHTRDADQDTVLVLEEFRGRVRGILHCFTGTAELAEKALSMGYDLSISGVVTFKNAEALREVVKATPLDRLHIETDSPFLAPVPHRGKKNRPVFVTHVADVVAGLKGVDLETLSRTLVENRKRLFTKID